MSFSVSLSATPGVAGMGKSVPLSLVSLLQSCREVQQSNNPHHELKNCDVQRLTLNLPVKLCH